jgi:hypothetical protein
MYVFDDFSMTFSKTNHSASKSNCHCHCHTPQPALARHSFEFTSSSILDFKIIICVVGMVEEFHEHASGGVGEAGLRSLRSRFRVMDFRGGTAREYEVQYVVQCIENCSNIVLVENVSVVENRIE